MMNARNGCLLALLVLLAACGRGPQLEAGEPQPDAQDPMPVVPALVPPSEVADPALPPSYEVAIATAAANRNKALERCAQQPEIVRTQCEQEANAAFAEAESGLQDLRGNQQ